jgi:alginate O-acetyltransferase complex protein AlgI
VSFCSQDYLFFFTAVFLAYWMLPWPRARVYLLLAASIAFYARWNRWLVAVICASTTLDYVLARAVDGALSERTRRSLVAASVVSNLALLSYFKYANFFLDSLEQALARTGARTSLPVLRVILPIGISFYTFEAISYVVDVYRGRCRAERNLPNLLLFILFFPHLVSGPIVRGRHFLLQIHRPKAWNWARLNLGLQLIAIGLFKKLALADRLALFVDPVFAHPAAYRTSTIWLGVLSYSMQIYCDFSGYTDIALGSAHLLGYKLPQNFAQPYFSPDISQFWRRWNMTLSAWLRDYLYIPLGGSRGSAATTARNLLVTMALGGLWHGARWTFVAWGVLHGALLALHHVWRAVRPGGQSIGNALPAARAVAASALTFTAVSVAWVLFRSTDMAAAGTTWWRMFAPHPGLGPPIAKAFVWTCVGILIAEHAAGRVRRFRLASVWLPPQVAGAGSAVLALLALLLSANSSRAFIYFQF